MSVTTTNAGGGVGALSETMISALFDSRADADRAIERLQAAGVPDALIRLTVGAEDAVDEAARTGDRGFFEALGAFFFPADDRTVYAEGLGRGGHLVTVSGLVGEGYTAALDILDDEGAVNIDDRESAWLADGWDRNQGLGWSGEPVVEAEPTLSADSLAPQADAMAHTTRATTSATAERARVDKRDTTLGRVRVRAFVRDTSSANDV